MSQKLSKNEILFWIKHVLLFLPYVFFIIINILKPAGEIKWSWHFGIWFPLTTYIVFFEGKKYFKIYKLMLKKMLNMHTLIGISSHVLYLYSVIISIINWNKPMYSYDVLWESPAILILITNIGAFIENRIKSSSLEVYTKLEKMKNAYVFVVKDGKMTKTHIKNVKKNSIISINKDSFIPLDGTLVSSSAILNYSNITGESKEIIIKKNQFVTSGSYNIGTPIKIKVQKESDDSTIALIIKNIENTTLAKPKLQLVADKLLKVFVPSVLTVSILTFILWMIIFNISDLNIPWKHINYSNRYLPLFAGVTVLSISCPCALGISTPLVYSVTSSLASQNGIIINNPHAIEELNNVKVIAFDKTGTLTSELFEIHKIKGDKKYIPVAKALERNVNHPIAKTISNISQKGSEKVSKIKYIHGKGVSGIWKDQKVQIKSSSQNESTFTEVALYVQGKKKLEFYLKNKIKDHVKKTIKNLKKRNIKLVMITGDEKKVANYIAKEVGIKTVYHNVSPEQKANIIKKYQDQNKKIAFVGDGFNDSLAIKVANVSMTFASGSEITNALSDVSFTQNSFYQIERLLVLTKMNMRNIILSLTYAFIFNVVAIPLAILLIVPPWLGASIMVVSDILVILNAFFYKKIGFIKMTNKKRA